MPTSCASSTIGRVGLTVLPHVPLQLQDRAAGVWPAAVLRQAVRGCVAGAGLRAAGGQERGGGAASGAHIRPRGYCRAGGAGGEGAADAGAGRARRHRFIAPQGRSGCACDFPLPAIPCRTSTQFWLPVPTAVNWQHPFLYVNLPFISFNHCLQQRNGDTHLVPVPRPPHASWPHQSPFLPPPVTPNASPAACSPPASLLPVSRISPTMPSW